jgi:cerevisin
VDVFGPGVGILSCGVKNNLDTAILSGTSQATPHIAGLAAVLLGEDPTLTPAQVKAKIQTLAIRGALSNIPAGTQNRVAFNGL